jgi:hypothetical protein
MKIYNLFLFLFTISSIQANPIIGDWISNVQHNIRTDHIPLHYHAQKIKYTKGGITIEYPDNYFANDPLVYISVELNDSRCPLSTTFTALITAKDTKTITVKVNKHVMGLFWSSTQEAEDDEIYVHVFSFGT